MLTQKAVEETFSRKGIRQHVINDIDTESVVFLSCVKCVDQLLNGAYYKSKNARYQFLKDSELTTFDIVTELFIAILPVEEITPIQSVATQLGNRLGFSNLLDGVKTASEIIAVCERTRLYTIYHSSDETNDTGTLALEPRYQANQETIDFIKKTMFLPPMLCKPKKWTNNSNGGHLKGSGSVILGALNHHDLEQNLESINIIQDIPWELNVKMLEFTEESKKPLDTEKKIKQFEAFRLQSIDVYKHLLRTGNKFYFTWKKDKRGRMYCLGYHVNLQSTQYKKAILQFHHKEVLEV